MKPRVHTKTIKNGIVLKTDKDPLVEYASLFRKERLACYGLMIMGGIFAFLGLLVAISLLANGEIYDEDQLLMFIPILVVPALFFAYAYYMLSRPKRIKNEWLAFCEEMKLEDEKFYRKHPCYDGERLYNKCHKQKVDLETTEGKARLSLIAKELKIEGSTEKLIELYYEGEAFINKEKAIKKDEAKRQKIAEAKEEENAFVKTAERYINLRDQKKRIYMANEVIAELKNQYSALEDGVHNAMNLSGKMTYQKEADWAIIGGIASGLAGPAAGIASALDAQSRNASVRASNENLRDLAARAGAYRALELAGKKIEVKEKITEWEKISQEAKLKLVEEGDPKALLKKLQPTVIKKSKRAGGSYNLTVQTKAVTVKIYDTVDAVVDGTFKANIVTEGNVVGSAYLILPYNGSEKAQTLNTICISAAEIPEKFDIVFEPYNLFAIEKI